MTNKSAFTLIELSIVLIIIALILGSAVGGKRMIKQGKMKQIIAEIQEYSDAYHKFQELYAARPGDFAGAESLWDLSTNIVKSGNDNGFIDFPTTTDVISESYGAWQHLALAELIKDQGFGNKGSSLSLTSGGVSDKKPILRARIAESSWSNKFGYMFYGRSLYFSQFCTAAGCYDSSGSNSKKPIAYFSTPETKISELADFLDLKLDDDDLTTGKLILETRSTTPSQVGLAIKLE